MTNAMTDSQRMELELEAMDAFHEVLIMYLQSPTPTTTAIVNDKMQELADVYKGGNALKNIKVFFTKFEGGDKKVWKNFEKNEAKRLFRKFPHLQPLFYEVAKQKGISTITN